MEILKVKVLLKSLFKSLNFEKFEEILSQIVLNRIHVLSYVLDRVLNFSVLERILKNSIHLNNLTQIKIQSHLDFLSFFKRTFRGADFWCISHWRVLLSEATLLVKIDFQGTFALSAFSHRSLIGINGNWSGVFSSNFASVLNRQSFLLNQSVSESKRTFRQNFLKNILRLQNWLWRLRGSQIMIVFPKPSQRRHVL